MSRLSFNHGTSSATSRECLNDFLQNQTSTNKLVIKKADNHSKEFFRSINFFSPSCYCTVASDE